MLFFDELFYEYVEKPHRERAEMLEQQRIEAIKAGKFVPGPLIHVPASILTAEAVDLRVKS